MLTFEDKPAPTMAHIALQKTAEENQELYPEAATAIKANSYMDDLCDSLDTVNQAQKQTEDNDKILETGGFRIKEWISNKTLNEEDSREEMAMKMLEGDSKEKVLGLEWKHKVDKFSYKVKVYLSNIKNEKDELKLTRPLLTKRGYPASNCKNLRSNWIRCFVPQSSNDRHPRIVDGGSRLGPRITRRDSKKVA